VGVGGVLAVSLLCKVDCGYIVAAFDQSEDFCAAFLGVGVVVAGEVDFTMFQVGGPDLLPGKHFDGFASGGADAACPADFDDANGVSTNFDSMPLYDAMIAIAEKRMDKAELAAVIRRLATGEFPEALAPGLRGITTFHSLKIKELFPYRHGG